MRPMLFVLGVIIGCSGPAVAQDVIPNIVGTWTGTADQVVQRLDGAGPVFQSGAMTLVVGQQ